MNDKDFLGYFEKLKKYERKEEVCGACKEILKIVHSVQQIHSKVSEKSTSSFGANIGEDLDFTLKKTFGGVTCTTS